MQLSTHSFFHLTYCTNIHPGDGWAEVLENIRQYAPALKARLSPDKPFGLGLRLSDAESTQLLERDALPEFRSFLDDQGLYISLINGFPFGSFHRRVIKEDVFAPDWRTEERVSYTLRLIEILTHLLPKEIDGGISTLPLSYKRWMATDHPAAWETITRHLVRIAEALVRARQQSGCFIHLDIEPEPDGLIENSAELLAFYDDWLLPVGAPLLAAALGVNLEAARQHLLDHLQVCFDTCHFAVAYEDPETALRRLTKAGIKIGRVQISSALQVMLPAGVEQRQQLAQDLEPFAESTYLHQVIEEREGSARRQYADLRDALKEIDDLTARQWRIHFHVPLFTKEYETFSSTQDYLKSIFRLLKRDSLTRHLEIETYTWEVLPPALKQDLLESIHREYRWVLDEFAEP